MVTDSESGYDKLLFAYHDMMNRWIEPAWKMFLSNKILLAALMGFTTPTIPTS